ncbi:MAG: calcium-binding protein [Pseudomonadota bacterium]
MRNNGIFRFEQISDTKVYFGVVAHFDYELGLDTGEFVRLRSTSGYTITGTNLALAPDWSGVTGDIETLRLQQTADVPRASLFRYSEDLTYSDLVTRTGDPLSFGDIRPADWTPTEYVYAGFGPNAFGSGDWTDWGALIARMTITGTARDDTIDNPSGVHLHVHGGDGDDYVNLDQGSGKFWGGRGEDTYRGPKPGSENLDKWSVFFGGKGDDGALYGAGNSRIKGGNGEDRILSQGFFGFTEIMPDTVRLNGGRGDDLIEVAGLDAIARGGKGDDHLVAEIGSMLLIGGQGADLFDFEIRAPSWRGTPWKIDATIGDYTLGLDRLDFNVAMDATTFETHAEQVGADTVFTMDGHRVVLSDIDLAQLLASDFLA